jgi:hypothetical protein
MENTQVIIGTLIPTVIILVAMVFALKEIYEIKGIIGEMKGILGRPIYGKKKDYDAQFRKEMAEIERNRKAAIKQYRKRGR